MRSSSKTGGRTLVGVLAMSAVLLAAVGSTPDRARATTPGTVTRTAIPNGGAPSVLSSSAGAGMVSFLAPLGEVDAQADPTNAGWLAGFLSVEVCRLTGSECGAVVARFDSRRSGAQRLHLETDSTGSYFLTVWHTRETRVVPGERYRLRVLVGPMEVGSRDLVVSSAGRGTSADPFPVRPGASLPVTFRVDGQSFTSGLAGLTVTPGVSPAGGVIDVAAPPLAMSGALQLFVAGELASVRTRSEGGLVAGVPLFLDASKWPAPPPGAVDVLLFRDGVAVALGRGALTVEPWQEAPGSAEHARHALGEIVTSFDRIGAAVATTPGEQQQWLTGLSRALGALVNGSDPRAFAGALAAADAAERRLLDAWFVESGMLAALDQYAGMVADAASAFKHGGTTAALSSLRTLAIAAPQAGPALMRMAPASTSFPTDLELSEAMQFYETVKEFGKTFVGDTNTTFGQYVGIAAGLIGLVRAVPAVAVISAVLAVADFAINKLLIALLPANIDRFELTLAEVLLEPGQITDAVLRLEAINDPPPIGVQDVIGALLSVLGVRDAPEIQSLTDALLQTANFMLTTIQNAIGTYANEHPELQLNTSIGAVPAMRWSTTVTNPTLVDRNSDTDAVVRGLPDAVNWQVQTGPDAVGEGLIYATTGANAFGDDFRNSNTVVVTVEDEDIDVEITPNSATLGPGDTQQFTAAVTNAANTDVTWTATGGAIDPDGTYIAGTATGTFHVTATSVADPSVTGTAFVQVTEESTLRLVPFCFAQDRPPLEFADRVFIDPFVVNAVGVLQYSSTVTGGLNTIRDGAGRVTGFVPGGVDGLQTATLTVTDPATGQSVTASWTWSISTLPRPEIPDQFVTQMFLTEGACQEGYVYRGA